MKTKLLICGIVLMNFLGVNAQVIATGGEHSIFLCTDKTVMSCGWNFYGLLSNGDTIDKSSPVQVTSLTGITAIAAGRTHSLFLKNDGTVWACGFNNSGQLGDGTTTIQRNTPVQVSGLTGITAIAAGRDHSLFLKNDGTVWACGGNWSGQLGNGTTNYDTITPVQIISLTGITAIAGGLAYSLFLKNDGTVWACGQNGVGQLGDGTTTERHTPIQVSSLTGITSITAGAYHSLFLKNDSTVWACGENSYGQLGDGTGIYRLTPVQVISLSGITALAGGEQHTLFLKNDSTVWGCGYNIYGQVGNGTTVNDSTPVHINFLSGIAAIAGGNNLSLFLKNDGSVWSAGENFYGQMGNGTTNGFNPNPVPIKALGLCHVDVLKINAYYTNTPPCADNLCCFTDLSTSKHVPITMWNWNFGDATPPNTNQNPCHFYEAAGTYNVRLIATNSNEDSDTIDNPLTVNTCIDIQTIWKNESINIFPNPFSTQTILQTDKILNDATLSVYSTDGQQVKQIKNISGQTITLHRDNLASGIYFLFLMQDNKTLVADKLVITDN